ncbi:hypothetical protein ACFVUQ_04535 [Streptomyces cyaneofuscatus]|uniref:hypothetical protein n=1 Tax=Streptomyces cyaneofuscatus TaxID=66883 RepID=UPI0036DF4F33
MTFDEERAEPRTAAAERGAVRINGVPAEGGGSGGAADLVVNRDDRGRGSAVAAR